MWQDPRLQGRRKKGFAMLIGVGTICLILSDREGCCCRGGKEKKESRENRRYDRRLQEQGRREEKG